MPLYRGACRITVVSVDADWPQRVVVKIRRGGTIVIPGTAGASELIDAEEWDIALEHEYEGNWRPNIRAVLGKWADTNGVQSQLIRSKDHDWPGDRMDRNLVLRIDRAGITAPTPARLADPRPVSTESDTTARRTTGSSAQVTTESSTPTRVGTQSGVPTPARPVTTSGQGGAGQISTSGGSY